jgi:coenzyme F420-0:L-glutamate ligase / coenzyme F420-1:gamma-L-glutamate ligase
MMSDVRLISRETHARGTMLDMTSVHPRDLILTALSGIPMIAGGDDLAAIVVKALRGAGLALVPGDVLVLAQKIVSKAEGRMVDLATIVPSARAVALADETGKDARIVELILAESTEVLRHRPGVLIVAHKLGLVLANAGIDRSNVDGRELVLLLPRDPDRSCAELRRAIAGATGVEVGVMIIDSIGRAWRNGTIGTAIGVAGLPGLLDLRGALDLFGRPLETTEVGLADELAAAASLVMGQAGEGTPVVLARGLGYGRRDGTASELIRAREKDLFR